jgi:hypothetical protein
MCTDFLHSARTLLPANINLTGKLVPKHPSQLKKGFTFVGKQQFSMKFVQICIELHVNRK